MKGLGSDSVQTVSTHSTLTLILTQQPVAEVPAATLPCSYFITYIRLTVLGPASWQLH
jgi:hypothetical protein